MKHLKLLLLLLLFPVLILSQESTLTGDVDCDGEITSQDASLILQFVTNVIDELPCQDNMTGLTPEQLQEIINMMDEQLSINYTGGGGSNYPIMISSISSEEMYWDSALTYCDELDEDGYNDWFLPNVDQLSYAVSGGCELPDERTGYSLWTRSPSSTTGSNIITLNESEGGLSSWYWNNSKFCRCVRLGEGETSEGSGDSSSSGSSLGGSSEQPITMIGPMYLVEEFPEFINLNIDNSNNGISSYSSLNFFDSIKFCSELEYNGYDDWYLPSFDQILMYYSKNGNFIIPNYDDATTNHFWTKQFSEQYELLIVEISGNNYMNSLWDGNSSIFSNYGNKIISTSQAYGNGGTVKKCFCIR